MFAAIKGWKDFAIDDAAERQRFSERVCEDRASLPIPRTQAMHFQSFRQRQNHWHRRTTLARLRIGGAAIPDRAGDEYLPIATGYAAVWSGKRRSVRCRIVGICVLEVVAGQEGILCRRFDTFIATQGNAYDLLSGILSLNNPAVPYTNDDVIIIHAVSWKKAQAKSGKTSTDTYQPAKGAWAFCRNKNKGKDEKLKNSCQQDYDLSGAPYLYDAPHIYFIDLNYFPDVVGGSKGKFAYQITTTPRQKENASSVATLVQSLLKVSPANMTAELDTIKGLDKSITPPIAQVWGTTTTVKASSPLPYDLAINETFTAITGSENDISCDKSACSFSRTVAHYDPEYWDLSLGVSVPGIMEPKYSSTGALTTPTRHTDAYAFFDIYLFQHFADAPASLTAIPHFNLGIPIAGQSLHRPYAGVAENLGFLKKHIKLSIPLAVFAGPVFLKQQVYDQSTAGLKWDHAVKMMYGLELPISAITKYMKSGGGSTTTTKTGGS